MGSPRRREGWGGVRLFLLIESPRGEGPGQKGPRGREVVCSELGNFGGGGGVKYFWEAEMSSKDLCSAPQRFVCDFLRFLQRLFFQKSLGVPKILVRKIWFNRPPPPPKRAQNEEKIVQISRNSSKLTLFPGGGERDVMDIWAFLILFSKIAGKLAICNLRLENAASSL